jgi:hypothetical protein
MMFAVAIGEVGVQTASLVNATHWVHFLPAYTHLFLATMVITTSWVGWTRSPSPGAREDVESVVGREFLVLLVDVFLVVVYFILVKSVDVKEGEPLRLTASAQPETRWILVIFAAYIFWDLVTKGADYVTNRKTQSLAKWAAEYGVRMIPTIGCFVFLYVMKPYFYAADAPHVLTADVALVCLILLFRTLKLVARPHAKRKWATICSVLLLLCLSLCTVWTAYSWPLPKSLVEQIQTTPAD